MTFKIGIVVGEQSGDKIAAGLIKELKKKYPDLEIEGVLGPNLLKLGCTELYNMDCLSVMGFVEPLFKIRSLYKMNIWLIKHFINNPPDLFIGVDAPDFNLRIEKKLKEVGIPTVHYVSPSLWAWRKNRIFTIKKSVDLVLALLPFETRIYQENNISVEFVGHPAADNIKINTDLELEKKQAQIKLNVISSQSDNINKDKIILTVMPGSRKSELKYMVPIYLLAIQKILLIKPNLQVIMPLIKDSHKDIVEKYIRKLNIYNIDIIYVINNSFLAMQACDMILVTSGTATLEVMLHKKPMVIAYKTNCLTYLIAKKLIKVPFIGLPNLLANKLIAPELIQQAANPDNIVKKLIEILDNTILQQEQVETYKDLHILLKQNANQKSAQAICNLLGKE